MLFAARFLFRCLPGRIPGGRRWAVGVALAAVLSGAPGCMPQEEPSPWRKPEPVVACTGTAVIQEVDPLLQTVVLKTDDGPLPAWWNPQSQISRSGRRIATFDGKPGETVRYHGPRAHGEQFLSVVEINPVPKTR